jgi:hypothetical protein
MPIFLSLVASALALQVPVGQPSRLRTLLPNGAVVLVEQRPQAKTICLQLLISSRGTQETQETHGYRHLMEHLEAKGRDHEIDQDLETHGAVLTAQTLRDATAYTITLRPGDLQLGLKAMASVMQLGTVTKDGIARESEIIRQEQALEGAPEKVSAMAWTKAYGEDGLDPSGDVETLSHATPEAISRLHKLAFVGPNLVMVVTGNVDLDATTAAVSSVLSFAQGANLAPLPMRNSQPLSGPALVSEESVALPVADFNSSQTAARLAAAFGLASQLENAFVTYTPSQRGGLIILGTSPGHNIAQKLLEVKAPNVFGFGRSLARQWLTRQIGPDSDGFLRGLLLVQGAGVRPETMLDNLNSMTVQDFSVAVDEFRGKKAVQLP